jgi:hypothetical protein
MYEFWVTGFETRGPREETQRVLTKLHTKDMRAIAWLNKHNLVFMAVVQRQPRLGHFYREKERRHPHLHHLVQRRMILHSSYDLLGNQFCAPESCLRGGRTGDEDGGVVDCYEDGLFIGREGRK